MNKNSDYIKQIAVSKMKSKDTIKTFAAFNKMFPITEDREDRDLPYDWVSSASRIQFSVIEKTETSKVCDVNLTLDEIRDLYDKTKAIYGIAVGNQFGLYNKDSESSDATGLCYTETFKMGTLKGKTPAQVADKDVLAKQKAFLSQNVAKYPDNQKLIDAIDDCLSKMAAGTLNQGASVSVGSAVYELINEQEKSRRSIKDNNGNSLVTGIRVACDLSRRLPFNITITHRYAPIQEAPDGRLLVQNSQSVNKQDVFVNLSLKDWNIFIAKCQKFVERYENYLASHMFELADKYAWKPEPQNPPKSSSWGTNGWGKK